MNQKAIAGTGVLSVALALACGATLAADAPPKAAEAPKVASSPLEAITAGKLTLNLRARYEHVDQAGKTDYADAFTNRTLLGWRTLPYYGISLYAEAIDVTRIGVQNYNDMSTACRAKGSSCSSPPACIARTSVTNSRNSSATPGCSTPCASRTTTRATTRPTRTSDSRRTARP